LNKPVEIARGGRVSNPVPGSAGPKAGSVPDSADDRRTESAVPSLEADMPEVLLTLPELALNAM